MALCGLKKISPPRQRISRSVSDSEGALFVHALAPKTFHATVIDRSLFLRFLIRVHAAYIYGETGHYCKKNESCEPPHVRLSFVRVATENSSISMLKFERKHPGGGPLGWKKQNGRIDETGNYQPIFSNRSARDVGQKCGVMIRAVRFRA